MMKKAAKIISIVLTMLMLALYVAGCGSSSNGTSSESSKSITSSSQAINAVKNYMSETSFSLEQRIAAA